MPELDDQSTDRLFQVGAERHDFTYDPAAWAQMEQMLDAEQNLRRRRGLLWFLAVLSGLTLVVATVWITRAAPLTTTAEAAAITSKTLGPLTAGAPTSSPPSENVGDTSPEGTDAAVVTVAAVNSSAREESDRAVTAAAGNPVRLQATVTSAPELDGDDPTATPGTAPAERSETSTVSPAVERGPNAAPPAAGANRLGRTLAISPLPAEEIAPVVPTAVVPQPVVAATASTFERVGSRNSLAVSAGSGFIVGRAGDDPFGRRQPRYGLEVEYRTGKRWALTTGALLNKVCYRTAGNNYHAKMDFWTRGVMPESVMGLCDVLEVPLTARYYFRGSRRSSFYVGAGTVSYLMLREKYDYEYAEPADDLRKKWTERNNNHHMLGMAQFNVGWQQKMHGRSYVKLDGFMHLPLTGIGHGDVRLVTAGVSLNYVFDFQRRK